MKLGPFAPSHPSDQTFLTASVVQWLRQGRSYYRRILQDTAGLPWIPQDSAG